jgi:paraquat-inducible protein B
MSATGFDVEIESVVSLLIGGIAFDARGDATSPPADQDAEFELYASQAASEREVYHLHTFFQLYFDQSVRGLHVGAPVEFRGIQIGEVRDIKLELDQQTERFRIPVLVAIEPERIAGASGLDPVARRQTLDQLVQAGLRAQLESGSLLTGQLLVQLDMHDGVSPAHIVWQEPYPQFPTIPTPLEEITSSVTRLAKRLEKVPLDKIGASVDATLQTARATLAQADKTLAAAASMVGPDSPFNTELRRALLELSDAARSIGLAADQIERQPSSLIFGKQGAQ